MSVITVIRKAEMKKALLFVGIAGGTGIFLFQVIGALLAKLYYNVGFLQQIIPFNSYSLLLSPFLTLCVISPIFWLITKAVPTAYVENKASLSFGKIIRLFLQIYIPVIGINAVSNAIMMTVSALKDSPVVNPVVDVMQATNPIMLIIGVVILAPIAEEIAFRGILLSKLRPYGNGVAIFVTSLIFALFHGNLYQMLYAFAIGAFLANIVMRTGKLRYSIILHMIFNFVGSVVPLSIFSENPALMVVGVIAMLTIVIASIVIVVIDITRHRYAFTKRDLISKADLKQFFTNPGSWVLIVAGLAITLLSIVM